MRLMTRLGIGLVLIVSGIACGADWTNWRGPDGTGFVADSNAPAVWNEQAIRWKVPIPGGGHSSPIILGDRVYLTTAVKNDEVGGGASEEAAPAPLMFESMPQDGNGSGEGRGGRGRGGRGRGRGGPPAASTNAYDFIVMALDRADGSVIWSTTVRTQVPHEGIHRTGTYAGGTPATDGTHLYAFFGSRGLYCLDLAGNVKWEADFGDMRVRNAFGEGASIAVADDTVVVPWDHEGDSFAFAVDKNTGEERWRVARDERTSWTTPVIVEVEGRTQAIMAGTTATISYDLATGEEIWRCTGLTSNVVPTPIVAHGMVYLTSGFRGSALQAVKLAGAAGDVTDSDAVAWSYDRGTPYVPSAMLAGRNLYLLRSNNGVVSCFDAVSGEPHYVGERLESVENVYASIVGAGKNVFICGREGTVVVLADGPELEVVTTNDLGEGIDSTPSIAGDEIYVRGTTHLFCIGAPESS